MAGVLTPRRHRGREYLDGRGVDAALAERSLHDVARANALLGGLRAVLAELGQALDEVPHEPATLLDVGSGLGDIAAAAREMAARRGRQLVTMGLETDEALTRRVRSRDLRMIVGDGLRLPLRDRSVDIVMCSQLLHHFPAEEGAQLLREMDRVARYRVLVSDLRRHWVAAAGVWLLSFPLRFDPVSRHDGALSVLRGFTRPELRALVRTAVGTEPAVHGHLGFRLTASWRPAA